MPIKVKVVRSRMKRVEVVRMPAQWQKYIELSTEPKNA